jgi:hypothetical protein
VLFRSSIYDISTFENLLLFDYYYTHPDKIKEFEITGKHNIFDYIKTHLEFDKEKTIRVYSEFLTFVKEIKSNPEYEEAYKLYKKIFVILGKDIKEKGVDKEKIDQLKEKCKTDMQLFKLTLATLEPFLNVQFSFVDNRATVSNLRNKTPPQKFTPTQYIVVSIDQSFLSTASTMKAEDDEYAGAGSDGSAGAGSDGGAGAGSDGGAGAQAYDEAGAEAGAEEPTVSKGEVSETKLREPIGPSGSAGSSS